MTKTSLPIWFLAIISSISPFGVAIMAPLIPSLSASLDRPVTDLQFLVSADVLGLAFTQPLVGMASDYFGHRRVLLTGFAFFVLASVGLTLSADFWSLVTFRFLQATGAGVGTVIARGIISHQMTPALALKAFATLTAVMGLTPIVAPIIAGYVVIVSTAHMVFALLILLGLLIFLGSWYLIPTSDDGHERRSLRDYVRGYRQLLQSRVFWSFTLGFGCLQGIFFALLACAALLFEQQFAIGVDQFSVIWSALAGVYITGSTLLSRFSTFGTFNTQRYCVALLSMTCIAAPVAVGLMGLTLMTLLVPLGLLMFFSGLLTPGTMLGAVNAVPNQSAGAAGLSSAGGMTLAAVFTYLGSRAYDTNPEWVIGVVAIAGLGFAISWWSAQLMLRSKREYIG